MCFVIKTNEEDVIMLKESVCDICENKSNISDKALMFIFSHSNINYKNRVISMAFYMTLVMFLNFVVRFLFKHNVLCWNKYTDMKILFDLFYIGIELKINYTMYQQSQPQQIYQR